MSRNGSIETDVVNHQFAEASKPLPDIVVPGYFGRGASIGANGSDLHPGEADVKSYFETLKRNADQIVAFRKNVDPKITLAAFYDKVEKAGDKFKQDALKGLAMAQKAAAGAVRARQLELDRAVDIGQPANGIEIRAALRGMTASQRQVVIQAATDIASPDKEVLGSIIGHNPVTHGVDMKLFNALVDNLKRKIAPLAYHNYDNAKVTAKIADDADPHVLAFAQRAYKGTDGYSKNIAATESILESYNFTFEP